MWWKGKGRGFLAGLLCLLASVVSAQDQKIADSLAKIYRQGVAEDTVRMELLRQLAFNEVKDLNLALRYAEELIRLAGAKGHNIYLYRGYQQKGNKKRLMGDLEEALDAYFRSAETARKASFSVGEGSAYGTIADVYNILNNHPNARLYYNKAIATLRRSGDTIALASTILNSGDEYLTRKVYDSAMIQFREAIYIFDKMKYEAGKAYSMGNIGMVYGNTGSKELAEKYINGAINILAGLGDYYPICVYLLAMADIYVDKGDERTALGYAARSLSLARQYGLKEQVSQSALKLSQIYEKRGDTGESLRYYKEHIAWRDSVNNIRSVQKIADLRTDYEVAQKQAEVDLLHQEKENQRIVNLSLGVILALTMVILGTLFWYYRTISREKKRSEGLLLNILPIETAKELKRKGVVEAVRVEGVSVMFTDFVEFSKQAEHVDPELLVKSIDFYFKAFDEISTKWGLEKIKTIGDSYMCACGLHTPNQVHARNVIGAAQDMIDLVAQELNATDGLTHFNVRIGIHTGPVVAGIVGTRKWQYDIWGDTVNIASRMESMSLPGRVNLSEVTYQQIRDEFPCEYRGEIEAKNHGPLKMYFLCKEDTEGYLAKPEGTVKVIDTTVPAAEPRPEYTDH